MSVKSQIYYYCNISNNELRIYCIIIYIVCSFLRSTLSSSPECQNIYLGTLSKMFFLTPLFNIGRIKAQKRIKS